MMMLERRWTCLLFAALALLLVAPRDAHAGAPSNQLRQQVDEVIRILGRPDRGSPAERQAIREVVGKIFDFQETAKRSLGPHWQQRTPAQREEFTRLFADLLEQSYISRIEQYTGEKVAYTGDALEGEQATVHTKILTKKGTEVPIDYRMEHKGDRWVVYDVVIEGMSLISNYRTQFNKIIRTSSYDDLVAKMRAKEFAPPPVGSTSKRPS